MFSHMIEHNDVNLYVTNTWVASVHTIHSTEFTLYKI